MQELVDCYNQKELEIVPIIKICDVLHITTDTFLFLEKFYPQKKFKLN